MENVINSANPPTDENRKKLDALFSSLKQAISKESNSELQSEFNLQVQNTFVKAIKEGKAPWLNEQDGSNLAPYNPATGQKFQKFNRLLLDVNQSLMGSKDPRWLPAAYLYENNFLIKKGSNPVTISYAHKKKDNTFATSFVKMYNGSQIENMPELQIDSVSNSPVKTYHPETLHPKDTLRADIANYTHAQDAKAPFQPKGKGRTDEVAKFLESSKSGTIFYIARDAQITAEKMMSARSEKSNSKVRETQSEIEIN